MHKLTRILSKALPNRRGPTSTATFCPAGSAAATNRNASHWSAKRLRGLQLLLGAALCVTSPTKISAQLPESQLGTRINSPFAAPLWRLDVDSSGSNIVTSSIGKYVTVWHAGALGAPKILSVPLRREEPQRAHAVAIAPSGELVAYSVPPAARPDGSPIVGSAIIYIMRRADGLIVRSIEGLPTRAQALRFSPDGRYLAATLSSGCGVRVWSASNWSMVFQDDTGYAPAGRTCCPPNATDCGALPDTTGVAFSKLAGQALRLFTAGDTGVRAYQLRGASFALTASTTPEGLDLERPEGIAVSPDGKMLVIGDRRSREANQSNQPIRLRVGVLDSNTLKTQHQLEINRDSPGVQFPALLNPLEVPDARQFTLPRVAWVETESGAAIFAAGFLACEVVKTVRRTEPRDNCIVKWSLQRVNEPPEFLPIGDDRVMDIVPSPAGKALLVASQRRLVALTSTGDPLALPNNDRFDRRSLAADFRDRNLAFRISDDAKNVSFADYQTSSLLRFSLPTLTLAQDSVAASEGLRAPNRDPNYVHGRPAAPGVVGNTEIAWLNSSLPPFFVGKPLKGEMGLDRNDVYRSVALAHDKRTAILGSANFLHIVRYADGEPRIACSLRIAEEALRVNITPDAALIVVGHGDGSLRWYRNQSVGEGCNIVLVLTVFVTRTEQNVPTFVAWVPSGDYFNHVLARDLVGWKAPGQTGTPTILDFSKLLDWHNRDAVVQALDREVQPGSNLGLPPVRVAELTQRAQGPSLSVHSPIFGYRATSDAAVPKVRVRLTRVGGGPWPRRLTVETDTRVGVRVDHGSKTYEPGVPIPFGASNSLLEIDVHLPEVVRLRNVFFHLCFYLDGELQTCHGIMWAGPTISPPRPRLWAIFVGFSLYTASSLNTLKYPQNDALDMARLFINDHVHQNEPRQTARAPADYRSVHVDLVVAPRTDAGRSELDAMRSTIPSLTITNRSPSLVGIVSALSDIAANKADGKLMHDVFLFYYSGHGLRNPHSRDKGLTLLSTPQMDPSVPVAEIAQSTFSSAVLIDWLNSIEASKIVILDACRVPAEVIGAVPFSASEMSAEFANRAVTTHVFFSADDGEYSYEQKEFALDRTRAEFGNSLFTYAFLSALGTPPVNASVSEKNQIRVAHVAAAIDRAFDVRDARSLISRMNTMRNSSSKLRQTPRYLPARTVPANPLVLRSIQP